jgi:hypothetical protein
MEQDLAATVDRVRHWNEQLWLGYEVPALAGSHLTTCSDWSDSSQAEDDCCGEYRLEDEHGMHSSSNGQAAQNVYVVLRFDKREPVKVRAVAAGCHLNAGGVNFDWITGVRLEESIAFLTGLVNQSPEHSRPDHSRTVEEGALVAISFHAAPEIARSLEQIASSSASEHTRERAAFWFGVQRRHDGFMALKSLENESTNDAIP